MPTLYLIPVPLADAAAPALLPQEHALIRHLTDFVVEAEKTARAHLKQMGTALPIRELNLSTLNEHTPPGQVGRLLQPLREGRDMGLLSEAGCPAVADPGAALVALAHREGHAVHPLVGPSSILLALMASGANGQRFAFHGYLPADREGRIGSLKDLQQRSRRLAETQIFIETPYRNDALLADALAHLDGDTLLCAACSLTAPDQEIHSRRISGWRALERLPSLHKRPAVFVLMAA